MTRETLLAQTFVELADTMVDDFDVVDLLTSLAGRCVDVFGVDAAGLMLAADSGELKVVASSSAAMGVLETFEVQAAEGPCPDCYRTGVPVLAPTLSDHADKWPTFVPEALSAGFNSAFAIPMRLRGSTIGALNLFRGRQGLMDAADLVAVQAFADIATIGLLQRRAAEEARVVNEQLTHALESRVLIEQAKGMVAERSAVSMDEAFSRMRAHARNKNLRLADVARDIVDGVLAPLTLYRGTRPKAP